jgi:hypothetical protein
MQQTSFLGADNHSTSQEITRLFTEPECLLPCSQESAQCDALGYGLDDRCSRVRFPAGVGTFSLHHSVQNGSVDDPVSYPMATRVLSLGVKRPGCESDHSTFV